MTAPDKGGLRRIVDAVAACPSVRSLIGRLPTPGDTLTLGGAVGSSRAAVIAALLPEVPVFLVVADAPAGAIDIEADLETLVGLEASHLFPQRESLPYESTEPHLEVAGRRIEAVEALLAGRTQVLVTTPRGLQERSALPTALSDLALDLEANGVLPFKALSQRLENMGFERVPLVEEVGQYAVRGGIVDLFSFGSAEPVRIEFWGDEIESIRAFDILDQRTTSMRSTVRILPVDFRPTVGPHHTQTNPGSLLDLLPEFEAAR